MTPPTFHIEADAPGEFLKLTLAGDWNEEISARFGVAVAATLRQMLVDGTRHGQLRTLIDMKRKNVLPQTVVADFAKMVRPDSPSKRIAMVFSGALHRMQVKRIADHRCALFDNVEEARAWLFAD
ncbi:hypothetical protein GCM10022253_15620 [Sphingomonas endophytica]|uniref:STAS/SEC14 domain-containing protein n=1 Tax=Sphingomonas endophytica TaxID=869719 RepID=A0A7X0JD49_9SPHN|nr:hypothetical protein [Sphingomonas endophytica]MBB5725606.1 hypothetical protein [Sphingomonas endophytica]MBB6505433.1 hypothetical protein [Sphingomonas endophytica]